MEWSYLLHPAFQTRQRLAASYMKGLTNVIEIGSYRIPIVHYLDGPHDNVVCIDNEFEPDVKLDSPYRSGRLVAKRVVYATEWPLPDRYADFGLALLGFGILGRDDELLELVRRSTVSVVEGWSNHPPFATFFGKLLEIDSHDKIILRMDMSQSRVVGGSNDWPVRNERTMIVLGPKV